MSAAETPLPLVAPCRALKTSAPLRWLRLGWQDIRHAPRLSLGYGFALTLLSMAVAGTTWAFGQMALYIGLATGFVFIGPVLALGLYSISQQLGAGLAPYFGYCIRDSKTHLKDLSIIGLVLLIVLLVWARAAAMVHIFMPVDFNRGWVENWQHMLPFLGIGSAVGALFATVVFSVSAFSLPMILDRRVDAITAILTSIRAVLDNKPAMLVWASLIGMTVLIGFATGLLGFIVLLPLIGHATWHAYQDTIDASAWGRNALPSTTTE